MVPDFGGTLKPRDHMVADNHCAKTGQVFATGAQLIRPAQGLPAPRRGFDSGNRGSCWLHRRRVRVASCSSRTLMCLSTEPHSHSRNSSFKDVNE